MEPGVSSWGIREESQGKWSGSMGKVLEANYQEVLHGEALEMGRRYVVALNHVGGNWIRITSLGFSTPMFETADGLRIAFERVARSIHPQVTVTTSDIEIDTINSEVDYQIVFTPLPIGHVAEAPDAREWAAQLAWELGRRPAGEIRVHKLWRAKTSAAPANLDLGETADPETISVGDIVLWGLGGVAALLVLAGLLRAGRWAVKG